MNIENNSAVAKIKGDPAYHTMQRNDANMKIHPACAQMGNNLACNNIMIMENNSAVVKIQGDLAYHTAQIDGTQRDEYDHYY